MIADWIEWKLRIKLNRSKQIEKKGIKLNEFINIEYCYIWLGIPDSDWWLISKINQSPRCIWFFPGLSVSTTTPLKDPRTWSVSQGLGGQGGGGWYSTNVYTARLRPEVQPLPFFTPYFMKKVPHSYTFYWQMLPFHIPCLELFEVINLLQAQITDFPTPLYTSTWEIPTLSYTWSLKRHPFRAEPPHHRNTHSGLDHSYLRIFDRGPK